MVATVASSLQVTAAARPFIFSKRVFRTSAAIAVDSNGSSWPKLSSTFHISSLQHFPRAFTSVPAKSDKFVTKAKSEASEKKPASVLPIDLRG